MTPDKIVVIIGGIASIVFIYWFFFGKKDTVVTASKDQDIIVDGGYSPAFIQVPKNVTTRLHFIRKDPSSCLEEVVIPDLKVKQYLPLNKETVITITPDKTGEMPFSCGMNMFHGKIIVK
jgi:plastocyanin domain-containing protein